MLFSAAPLSLTLERRILGRAVLRHVIVIIILLLIVVVFIVTVVAVFVIIAALVGRRLSVAPLRVPPMLVRRKKKNQNSHKIILRLLFSSNIPAVVNSPERTGHPPHGWSPGSCGFWAFLVDRSQSHSCQSWSCWRASGAGKGRRGAMKEQKANFK